jgi:large subunit ribosomal protein L20
MARVKRGNVARNRRKKVLKLAKGFRGGLSKLFKPAKFAVMHAMQNMYKHRRLRKRDFRGLWIARINGALSNTELSYSKFIGQLNKKEIFINRKMLAELAVNNPDVFTELVTLAQEKA